MTEVLTPAGQLAAVCLVLLVAWLVSRWTGSTEPRNPGWHDYHD